MSRDQNPISDSVILLSVIEALKLTKNGFATKCKYKSSMSVYNVLEGRNGLSDDTINRITLAFPEVNYNYLKSGVGPILKGMAEVDLYRNMMNIAKEPNNFERAADLNSIPETLLRIELLLHKILDK
jgi:hypothetical protein